MQQLAHLIRINKHTCIEFVINLDHSCTVYHSRWNSLGSRPLHANIRYCRVH